MTAASQPSTDTASTSPLPARVEAGLGEGVRVDLPRAWGDLGAAGKRGRVVRDAVGRQFWAHLLTLLARPMRAPLVWAALQPCEVVAGQSCAASAAGDGMTVESYEHLQTLKHAKAR